MKTVEDGCTVPGCGLTKPSTGAEGVIVMVRVVVMGSWMPSSTLSVMMWSPALNRSSNKSQSSPSGVRRPSRLLVHVTTKNSDPEAGSNGAQTHEPSVGNVEHAASASPEPLAEKKMSSELSNV